MNLPKQFSKVNSPPIKLTVKESKNVVLIVNKIFPVTCGNYDSFKFSKFSDDTTYSVLGDSRKCYSNNMGDPRTSYSNSMGDQLRDSRAQGL